MAYISHVSGEGRLFDFKYDPSFTLPSKKDEIKAAQLARVLTSPAQVLPRYNEIFSDMPAKDRQKKISTTDFLKVHRLSGGGSNKNYYKRRNKGEKQDLTQRIPKCVQGHNVNIELMSEKSLENIQYKTASSQTVYRESSAQTKEYEPDMGNALDEVKDLELFHLKKFIDGSNYPDNLDIETVERNRHRLAYEKFVSDIDNIADKLKEKSHLEIFEWEAWIARERLIFDCQKLRMLIVCRIFYERDEKFRSTSDKKITDKVIEADAKRKHGLRKNDSEYKRKLRKLNNKYFDRTQKYKRGNITKEHIDFTSNLHGPQMRFGSNAKNSHLVNIRRDFNVRIDALEKRAQQEQHTTKKIRWLTELSKPKTYTRDYHKDFQDEKKIQHIYESLRSTALECEEFLKPKVPQCIKPIKQNVVYDPHEEQERNKKSIQIDVCDAYPKFKTKMEVINPVHVVESQILNDATIIDTIIRKQCEILQQQATYNKTMNNKKQYDDVVGEFQGKKIGWMLDFLNKELKRLKEMENIEAFCMLAQCERLKIEKTEAKMRDTENDFRAKNETSWKHRDYIKSDVVQTYFENVLMKNMEIVAEEDARNKVKEVIAKTNRDCKLSADKRHKTLSIFELETIINEFFYTNIPRRMDDNSAKLMEDSYMHACQELYDNQLHELFGKKSKIEQNSDLMDTIFGDVIQKVVPTEEEISEINSESSNDDGEYEAQMAIKKILQRIFPKNHWKHIPSSTKIVKSILDDIIDDIYSDKYMYELYQTLLKASMNDSNDYFDDDDVDDIDDNGEKLKAVRTISATSCIQNKMAITDTISDCTSLKSVGKMYDIIRKTAPSAVFSEGTSSTMDISLDTQSSCYKERHNLLFNQIEGNVEGSNHSKLNYNIGRSPTFLIGSSCSLNFTDKRKRSCTKDFIDGSTTAMCNLLSAKPTQEFSKTGFSISSNKGSQTINYKTTEDNDSKMNIKRSQAHSSEFFRNVSSSPGYKDLTDKQHYKKPCKENWEEECSETSTQIEDYHNTYVNEMGEDALMYDKSHASDLFELGNMEEAIESDQSTSPNTSHKSLLASSKMVRPKKAVPKSSNISCEYSDSSSQSEVCNIQFIQQ